MILSIGMIVKNEEKYLDKCLFALKPILDNVDSELIIADTGSTDRTVEIAKKYTDKVLHFDWVNDFSAARNFTLDNSAGEWFMYIDADEILASCDEIIAFFNSGEYKKYSTATYIQRNYADEKLSRYSDFMAPRMTRRSAEVRFIHPIHEGIAPFEAPVKHLMTVADHYGYIFEDSDFQQKKIERNAKLLLERLKNDRSPEMTLYLQLYQCFLRNDPDRAMEYLNEGIKKCLAKNDITVIPLYIEKAAYFYTQKNWQGILDICDKYFALNKAIRPGKLSADSEMYFLKATVLQIMNKPKAALEAYLNFFEVFNEVSSGRLITTEMMISNFKFANSSNFDTILHYFLELCISEKQFAAAGKVLDSVNTAPYYQNHDKIKAQLEQEFAVMQNTEYKRAEVLYSQLDDYGKKHYRSLVRFVIETADDKTLPLDVFRKVCREDNQFSALLNVIYAHYIRSDCSSEIAELIQSGCTEYYELLYFMLSEQQDVSPLITSECYNLTEALSFCSDRFDDMFTILEKYYPKHISDIKAFLSLCEAAMLLSIQNQRDIEALFALWGKAVSSEESIDEKDGQLYAAALANVILHSWHNGNIKTCIGAMSAAVKKYPQSKPFILAMRNKVQQSISAPKPNNEMDALASTVKKNIRSLISSGKTEEAKRVFEEYLKINPTDPDIPGLKQLLQ